MGFVGLGMVLWFLVLLVVVFVLFLLLLFRVFVSWFLCI